MADQANQRDQVVPGSTIITVYNGQPSLVRELREIEVQAGEHWLVLDGLSPLIDFASVQVKTVEGAEQVSILQQSHSALYNVGSGGSTKRSFTESYLNHAVELITKEGDRITGTLLHYGSERDLLIDQNGTPILILASSVSYIRLVEGEYKMGDVVQLRLLVENAGATRHIFELHYLTPGLHWYAEYQLLIKKENYSIEGWAQIKNVTGKSFSQATVRLLSGNLNQAYEIDAVPQERARGINMPFTRSKSVEQEEVNEYKMFPLPQSVSLTNGQVHQVPLINTTFASAKTVYLYRSSLRYPGRAVYERAYGQKAVSLDTVLEFSASRENGFTTALPRGRVRVYQQDEAGVRVLIGEDNLGNTALGELVRVKLGGAFDLKGEQAQKAFERESNRIDETLEITLHNYKADGQSVEVKVVQYPFRSADWELLSSTHPAEQVDARTLEFTIPIPAQGKTTMRYTVRYHMPPDEQR